MIPSTWLFNARKPKRKKHEELKDEETAVNHSAKISSQPYCSSLQLEMTEYGVYSVVPGKGSIQNDILLDDDFKQLSFPQPILLV